MPLVVDSRGNASLNFVIPERIGVQMKKVFTTKSVKNMIETKRFSLKKKDSNDQTYKKYLFK